MIIGGIQRTSTIDFPGILSCVLFCRGCDMNCFYCHNRAMTYFFGESIDDDSLNEFLNKRKGLLDGVVISGGEPTLQPDLGDFIEKIKSMGYKVKLDTNGQKPGVIAGLVGSVDYFAVDVKASEFDYIFVCEREGFSGVSETLKILSGADTKFEVRTTLYPGMTLDDLQILFSSFPPMPVWRLNYFRMPERYLKEHEELLGRYALNCADIRGAEAALRNLQPNLIID